MLRNYLKIAFRNLLKHRAYSLINVAGLVVGMASTIVMLLFVQYHLNFDRFHEKSNRIYRAVANDNIRQSKPLGPALVDALPEVEAYAAFWPYTNLMSHGEKKLFQRIHWVNQEVFSLFTLPLIQGDPRTALKDPGSIVLAEAVARRFFGDVNPVGKTADIEGYPFPFRITGIMQDCPQQSHIDFQALAYSHDDPGRWGHRESHLYIRTSEGYTPDGKIASKITELYERHANWSLTGERRPILQPLRDVHTQVSEFPNWLGPSISIDLLYTLVAAALFVLLISSVNFITLSTARAINRSREVGMRKVIGAQRSQLMRQFLGESLITAVIALCLAVALVGLILPSISNTIFGDQLKLSILSDQQQLLGLAGIALFVGLVAGSYPALVLSAFKPVVVLKGMSASSRGALIRRGLVMLQFVLAVVLIVGTMLTWRQVQFLKQKDLGFLQELVAIIYVYKADVRDRFPALRAEWLKDQRVRDATISKRPPGDFVVPGELRIPGAEKGPYAGLLSVRYNYFEFYEIDLLAGRAFSEDHPTDRTEACMVNETALREFGLGTAAEAIGKRISWNSTRPYENGNNIRSGQIVGVFEDIHLESLYHKIKPAILFMEPGWDNFIGVKIAPGDVASTMEWLEKVWSVIVPELPPRFSFIDERLARNYREIEQAVDIFMIFAGLAIVVTCLGLFGLASFTTSQRTKEIGIRKSLGASVANIVLMLSGEITRIVLVAIPIAWLLTYFAANQLLQRYAYRTGMAPELFILGGVLALLVAWLSVGFRTLRAARTNPVEALRYE